MAFETKGLEGSIYHIEGACQGSYDLMAAAGVSSGAAKDVSDLVNTDDAGADFTGSFTTGTGNDTKYVKTDKAYDDVDQHAAKSEYDEGTASSTVTNPKVGDVYIAKLRGTNDYAVLEITKNNVDGDCGKTTGNKGDLTFNFKK